MLDLNFIEKYRQAHHLPRNKRRLITEYLQTIILEIIASSSFNQDIIFMGGTCLRFIYKIQRFSEDLDFDLNPKKKKFDFDKFCDYLSHELKLQGFNIYTKETENKELYKLAIRFSEILNQANLSPFKNEKLTINIEIDKNPSKYLQTETKMIDHFNKIFPIFVNNKSTLFAEKVKAALLRKYTKARDFFDLVFFLSDSKTEPNYAILKEKKIKIKNYQELQQKLIAKIKKIKLSQIINDLKPYIFYPQQLILVKKFLESMLKNDKSKS